MIKEKEVGLGDYIKIVVKRYRFILTFAFTCAFLAGAVSLFMPNIFKAEAILLVMPPQFKSELEPPTLSVQSYKELLQTTVLIRKLMDKLEIKNISLTSFLDQNLGVELIEESRKGTEIIQSPLIKLIVKTGNKTMANKIANAWADLFIESNTELFTKEKSTLYNYVNNQYVQTQKELEISKGKLNNLRDQYNFTLKENEYKDIESNLGKYNAQFAKTKSAITLKQSELTALREILKDQKKCIVLSKAIVDDALWQTMTQAQRNSKLEESKLKSEEINPVYQQLQQDIVNIERSILVLQTQEKNLEQLIPKSIERLKPLREEFFKKEAERSRLALDLHSYETRCKALNEKREELSSTTEGVLTDIKIAAYAVEPEGKIGPNKKLNVILAGLIGLVMGVFLAFIKDYLSDSSDGVNIEDESSKK